MMIVSGAHCDLLSWKSNQPAIGKSNNNDADFTHHSVASRN
jgi:hypothetical protein